MTRKEFEMKRVMLFLSLIAATLLLAACGPGQDPLKVVTAYRKAEDAGDYDKALTYLANDVVYVVGGSDSAPGPFDGRYEGKAAVRELLGDSANATAAGTLKIESSNMRASGDAVRIDVKVRWGGELVRAGYDLYVVRQGRIVYIGPESAAAEMGLL
ncbi:MAG: nuclear transport factor 2 family protein [Anaerolineae bacterium]|nr:nuclear transport factor 2 family protein [Anaerolineae bacterium]